jgi:hypothetical protein
MGCDTIPVRIKLSTSTPSGVSAALAAQGLPTMHPALVQAPPTIHPRASRLVLGGARAATSRAANKHRNTMDCNFIVLLVVGTVGPRDSIVTIVSWEESSQERTQRAVVVSKI